MVNNIRFFMLSAIFSVGTIAHGPGHWRRRHADDAGHADGKDPADFGYEANEPNSDGENFFQEIYMLQSAPKQIEFGHVCENPHEWEQRYEKKDFDRNRHQGKVRWADKRGSHGEHYWDYNHAGPSTIKEDESKDQKQHHKRQLSNEEKEIEGKEEDTAFSKEAREFLESFHREIEGVFNLKLNRNLPSQQKTDPFQHMSDNFRFFMPKIKNESEKSQHST